ncbi:hypothetical protein [Streptomyces griseorubiginosus]|uniref:hypothetical protein n=1 Tax=Streptomyces griseorubiginosus TaxID=67304 RepID=UPI0033C282B6
MSDDLSLGELGRIIQGLRADVRDDMAGIQRRLDRLVSLDVYTVEKAAMSKDIADLAKDIDVLRQQREKDQEQRQKDVDRVTQTRRWMVGTVLIPVLGLILPVIIFLVGGK